MKTRPVGGYTIVEVLIFLAVSALIFASAAIAIGGQQQNVQYSQAVREFEIQVKDAINDVANGFYPAYTDVACRENASNEVEFYEPAATSDDGDPGTSNACANIGKSILVNVASRDDSFGLGTITGVNQTVGEAPDLTLSGLAPTLAYENPLIGASTATTFDLTTYEPIRWGAEVTKIALTDSTSTQFTSLHFISDFSGDIGIVGTTGALVTNVYGVNGSTATEPARRSIEQYANEVQKLDTAANYEKNPEGGFYICLQMPDEKIARVFVGVDGVPTATATEFDLDPGDICPLV